ncbi:MAG TPA: hypothetical protein VGL84_01830, partial [Gaiellaceae bacterium]
MHAVIVALSALSSVVFAALAVLTAWHWLRRRDEAAGRLALTFISLGLLVTVGRLLPSHPHGLAEDIGLRVEIELLVLFPYFLYGFAVAFAPPSRRLRLVVNTLTGALTVWTFALPSVPRAGEPRPWWFVV